jgi:protein gp37
MADNTKIEWTDATVNAVNGCTVVSPGCTNCYAMRLAGTRMKDHPTRKGLTIDSKAGPVWNGEIRVNEKAMLEPLRWAKPRMCFWNAHGDLFHPAVPDEVIDRCFAVMALTPHHTHQVLTKRSARMRAYFAERWQGTPARQIDCGSAGIIDIPAGGETGRRHQVEIACEDIIDDLGLADTRKPHLWTEDGSLKLSQWAWPLPNVWLGVSVEDQQRADERIVDLLQTPAAIRWLSCEPLLGPVDLTRVHFGTCGFDPAEGSGLEGLHTLRMNINALAGVQSFGWPGLDWIVVGGESGPGARPMHPDWARSLRDQCATAGVPFLFKQWGEWAPIDGPRVKGCIANRSAWPAGERPKVEMIRLDHTGRSWAAKDRSAPTIYHSYLMAKLGKRTAGRLLDGVQHDGYPA